MDAGDAAKRLGLTVRQFIEEAEKAGIDSVTTNVGRYCDRRDVRQLALKLAALTKDADRKERLRAAARGLAGSD